jgi:hypothetical protein
MLLLNHSTGALPSGAAGGCAGILPSGAAGIEACGAVFGPAGGASGSCVFLHPAKAVSIATTRMHLISLVMNCIETLQYFH